MAGENHVIFIAGPTGVGKSALAERIAAAGNADIINMDVGQFYTPLTIGTAKPLWRESPIPHHLFDIINEPSNLSVVTYRERVRSLLQEIWAQGRLPILVGGSAFYLKALLFPIQHEVLITEEDGIDLSGNLWEKLAAVDPERAKSIHCNDAYRIKRALIIAKRTGQKPSSYAVTYNPPSPSYTLLWVTRDREDLYARINQRVQSMLEGGWLDEVRMLQGTDWPAFLQTKKLIGYHELFTFMQNEDAQSLDEVALVIAQRTRQYAKRQEIFWRMLRKEIEKNLQMNDSGHTAAVTMQELNLTLLDLDLYIKQLLERLSDKEY